MHTTTAPQPSIMQMPHSKCIHINVARAYWYGMSHVVPLFAHSCHKPALLHHNCTSFVALLCSDRVICSSGSLLQISWKANSSLMCCAPFSALVPRFQSRTALWSLTLKYRSGIQRCSSELAQLEEDEGTWLIFELK